MKKKTNEFYISKLLMKNSHAHVRQGSAYICDCGKGEKGKENAELIVKALDQYQRILNLGENEK